MGPQFRSRTWVHAEGYLADLCIEGERLQFVFAVERLGVKGREDEWVL